MTVEEIASNTSSAVIFSRAHRTLHVCLSLFSSLGLASNPRESLLKWRIRWVDLLLARRVGDPYDSVVSTTDVRSLFGYRTEKELAGMDDAHEGTIWDMSWHPLGHMLVSGSNDHTTFVEWDRREARRSRVCLFSDGSGRAIDPVIQCLSEARMAT